MDEKVSSCGVRSTKPYRALQLWIGCGRDGFLQFPRKTRASLVIFRTLFGNSQRQWKRESDKSWICGSWRVQFAKDFTQHLRPSARKSLPRILARQTSQAAFCNSSKRLGSGLANFEVDQSLIWKKKSRLTKCSEGVPCSSLVTSPERALNIMPRTAVLQAFHTMSFCFQRREMNLPCEICERYMCILRAPEETFLSTAQS